MVQQGQLKLLLNKMFNTFICHEILLNMQQHSSILFDSDNSLLFQTTPTRPQTITFSRLPDERQKLLSQRKKEMLENARRY